MKLSDLLELVILAALWGGSFLFMRIATPEFGPVALIALRVGIAALFLTPILLFRSGFTPLRGKWRSIFVVGALNSALPFCLFAFSTLHLTGGFTSILNATAPLWGALIAWVWLGDRLSRSRTVGLLVGFAGVLVLVQGKLGVRIEGGALAVPAALLATLSYGIAANYTKQTLTGVDPLAVATGSQITAAALLLWPAILLWPDQPISTTAWLALLVMAIASTGIAYVLYFRLIASVGPARAISVTYLIPLFGVLWGSLFLDEALSPNMIFGGAIILIGTALATGVARLPGAAKRQER